MSSENIMVTDEIIIIQENYKKLKLKEALTGPLVSTAFHLLLIIVATFIKGETKAPSPQVEITQKVEELVEEPPPPPPPPPPPSEPEIQEQEQTVDPDLNVSEVDIPEDLNSDIQEISEEPPSASILDDMEMPQDIKASTSPLHSAKMFSGRSASSRASALSKYGGSQKSQASLNNALDWLAKNQNPDGTWGHGHKAAMTSLATLTFLARGETGKSKQYGQVMNKAFSKLAEWGNNYKQFPIGRNTKSKVYEHALVAYALSEAYGMTGIYTLKDPMDLTIQFICENQHEDGGFYYDYAKGNVTNFSNAGFNWQAMKAANVAGCTVSELPNAISKSINHIKTHASATGFYYWTTRPQKRDTSMRALGTLCLQLFGENDDPIVKRMSSFVVNDDYKLMNWQDHGSYERPAAHYLYWMYYATQVAFRSGGKNWTKWNKTFQKLLIENQHPDGYWLSPATRIDIGREMMASIDDKVYSTTLCALQLTVYYRYLPSSKTTQKVQNTHVEEIVDIF